MSPFGQLTSHLGFNGGIDRDFNPVLNYVDELDRHFSRRHHLLNCFIPRFDLEEDSQCYYLYGEIAGASAENITIEPRDKNTLVIYGTTHRPGTGVGSRIKNNSHHVPSPTKAKGAENNDDAKADSSSPIGNLARVSPHSEQRAHDDSTSDIETKNTSEVPPLSSHRTLLSERLVGEFHRTFSFPTPIVEEAIRASMADGVLTVLIPKMERNGAEKAKRIPIKQVF